MIAVIIKFPNLTLFIFMKLNFFMTKAVFAYILDLLCLPGR